MILNLTVNKLLRVAPHHRINGPSRIRFTLSQNEYNTQIISLRSRNEKKVLTILIINFLIIR